MIKLSIFLSAIALAIPVAAQIPISGLGRSGSGREQTLRRQWLGTEDRFGPGRDPQVGAQLVGQLRQADRRASRERDEGLISRDEARRVHREAARIGMLYGRYSSDGLSAAEAAELQNRIYLLQSTPRPAPHGH